MMTPATASPSPYAHLVSRALFPAWERLRGRETYSRYAELLSSQWKPRAELFDFQMGELRKLLTFAEAHIPYYREVFREQGFSPRAVTRREDLLALPILTKDIIRSRYSDLVSPAHRDENIVKGTSGSTGVPLKFEYSRSSEAWRQATRLRAYGWGGYVQGARTLHYWAQIAKLPLTFHGIKTRLERAAKREMWVNSMRQDEEHLRGAAEAISRFRPTVIIAYTQACAELARFVTDRGLRDWDDIPVLCGAEAVLPADRAALEGAFGKHIFDTYGSRETMLLASECEAHDGLHLSDENLLVEVLKDGKPAAPGETGEVVVTDLHNHGMPLIRYANGDLAVMGPDEPCRCGRGLRRLARVEGRRTDTLRDTAGNPVPGILLHVLFADARKDLVRQFQAVQRASGDVVLRVVRGREWNEEAFAAAVARFRDYLRGAKIEVEFHESIAPGPNGKRRTLVVESPVRAQA